MNRWKATLHKNERGQALIIIALSFVALLGFVGLVTDVGSLYVTYTQLKRAVDAAAVAAANNIKLPQATEAQRKLRITEAAREMLAFHNVVDVASLTVFLCSDSGLPADFDAMCPDPGQPPRKLAYVQATQDSPVFFLRLFGVQSIPFTTSSVGEAATVDLVMVIDTSESMGVDSTGYVPDDFNPATCNAGNTCRPLLQAKNAAKGLIANLFSGYDRVAIVTFDYDAEVQFALNSNLGDDDVWGAPFDGDALDAVDNLVVLHNDAPGDAVPWSPYYEPPPNRHLRFNPIYPEDRDGDGNDQDDGAPCEDESQIDPDDPFSFVEPDLLDDSTGEPCDRDDMRDVFDWDDDGHHYMIDPLTGVVLGPDPDDAARQPATREGYSLPSTCSGCGIRVGADALKAGGRPNSVWVMVFLSDGVANLSDTHATFGDIPASYKYGFCGDDPQNSYWYDYCIDWNIDQNDWDSAPGNDWNSWGRYCIDDDSSECPAVEFPDSTHWELYSTPTTNSGPYSVEDYAFDMIDAAGLIESYNVNEPHGESIIMYAIGLGDASAGERLLRYMANVGDEGLRENDLCAGIATRRPCGNYYYSPTGDYLDQIFESIANRIFTKISR